MIRGDVWREDQGIRRDTPWLELRMMPEAVVEISLQGGARKLRAAVSTVGGGTSTEVELDALFAGAATR